MSLVRRLATEALGTALLLAAIVGLGIMGERLSAGNGAVALLANNLATGCALYVLITTLAPISGAHLNPAVSVALAIGRAFAWRDVVPYVLVQTAGALVGVVAAHWMFELPAFMSSTHVRTGPSQWWSEGVATFGLLLTIICGARARPGLVPELVAAYITAAYWFTASTSFANPAVTIARSTTDTFSGIHPDNIYAFIAAQFVGATVATVFAIWLSGAQGD